jgi:hypothetical protein
VTNSGIIGSGSGIALVAQATGNATVNNSGFANGGLLIVAGANATLNNMVGGRVFGPVQLASLTNNTINFQGGNWLLTITISRSAAKSS